MENIGEAIWKSVGAKPGPTVVLFGGTHGNELTGIEVVKKMRDAIESKQLMIESGTFYLILGNPRAIERNTRGSEDHADLNRCFKRDVLDSVPSSLGKGGDGGGSVSYEFGRAKEIARILVDANISIDLHATNKPSVPFLCCLADDKHEQVYRWFDCDRVLADPRYILANEPVTTDEFLDLQGGTGVCYETGFVGDLTRVDIVYENVLNVLRDQKMIANTAPSPFEAVRGSEEPSGSRRGEGGGRGVAKQVFELVECVYLTEAGFTFADGFGNGSFVEFIKGQTIGYVGENIFAPDFDGVIVFPKLPEFQALGKPVVYLAKQVR